MCRNNGMSTRKVHCVKGIDWGKAFDRDTLGYTLLAGQGETGFCSKLPMVLRRMRALGLMQGKPLTATTTIRLGAISGRLLHWHFAVTGGF